VRRRCGHTGFAALAVREISVTICRAQIEVIMEHRQNVQLNGQEMPTDNVRRVWPTAYRR